MKLTATQLVRTAVLRSRLAILFMVAIALSNTVFAQAETEPNNTFESAISIDKLVVRTGSVDSRTVGGVPIDQYDYYMAVLPEDGTLKIYVNATNNHTSNAYLYMYGYDRRKASGQVFGRYIGNNSNIAVGSSVSDEIIIHGRAADTFYFRLETSGVFSYNISYDIMATSPNDDEPNNSFDQSLSIDRQQVRQGHIGYTYAGTTDANDFYRGVTSNDGTLTIYVQGKNNSGSNGYLYMYAYDRRKSSGQIMAKFIANHSNITPDSTIYDTIRLYGRAADTVYFSMTSSGAFSYSFHYNVTDTSTNDIEPNDAFATALPISINQEKEGHIGYKKNGQDDANDFYKTMLPYDGTLRLIVEGTNRSGGNGYLYMYAYDKRQGSGQIMARYINNNSNVPHNAPIRDTILLYGRAADTTYFRFVSSGAFSYKFHYDILDTTTNDIEPNDDFSEPILINQLEEKRGHISYAKNGTVDQYDYYKTVIPIDGTLKVYIQGTNRSGGNGYLYLSGFDRRKGAGQIFATYVSGSSNIRPDSTIYDTITIYGVLADTFYFRVQSAGAFNYQISYNTTPNSAFDPEPNNEFVEAVGVRQGVQQQGQIGYTLGGNRDNYDYYVTNLPADGTLKIMVQGTNNSGTNGYLYIYAFDKRRASGQVLAKYISNNSNVPAGTTIYDTIYLYGRAADTMYFRMESSQPFSYSFSYDIIDSSENDVEPNNSFAEALPIEHGIAKKGHIEYVKSGTGDASDYYRTVLPVDGTVKIIVSGTNQSGGNGYLYIYAYDRRKASGQILARYVSNNSNVAHRTTVYDTIYLYGRAADTTYFRITASGAFNYTLRYELVDTSANDAEPNNTFEQAVPIASEEVKRGHISYMFNGTDDANDYYVTKLPYDGTLRIIVQGRNRSGGNGYLYLYAYDRRKASGQILAKYVANHSNLAADTTINDTIYLHGRAADTTYFRITSSGAWSYQISYEMADISANDAEPNGTFETAILISRLEEKKGHVNYSSNGSADTYDYYVTRLPEDGTLKIMVSGKNNGGTNGYLYMYGFDRRKASGQILSKYVSNNSNIAAGATIYDTIYLHCRAADTVYFRLEASTAFSYSISYDMENLSANDTEPNNSFATATPARIDSTYAGHIGYVKGGTDDTDDYYVTAIPEKGIVRVAINGRNNSGGSGYMYVYAYDRRRGSGQILARYIQNNSNVAAGAVINDTLVFNCATFDTLYLRITSVGCFSYTITPMLQSLQPKADFSYTRVGNQFGFEMNPNSNGTSFTWDLGNGVTTNATVPPLVTYQPGFYQAKLIARNTTASCLFTDTATLSFTVRGIERYTPDSSGPGNVGMTIYGGGLDTNVTVTLKMGAMEFSDSLRFVNKYGNIYNAIIDMHNAQPGLYDVFIATADSTYHYPDGFTVLPLMDKLRIQIVGNTQIRTNVDNIFTIRVHNEGNTLSGISKVYMLTAPNITVTELDSLIPIASNQYVNPDSLPHVLQVTTAQGFPITGNIRGFYIYGIPAGHYRDLRFKFNFQPGVSDVHVWSSGPISGSPDRNWSADCWKARAKLAYESINYPLDLIPVVDCGWNLVKLGVSGVYNLSKAFLGMFSDAYDAGGAMASLTKVGLKAAKSCAGEAGVALTGPAGLALETADIGTDILANTLSTQQAYYDWLEKCNEEPKDDDKKRTDARTSWDPNAKTGPSGYGVNKYINGSERLITYGIFFENLPAASLPAQNIFIYDTLDKSVYDLASLNVESFSIGEKVYHFSPDQQEYVANVNISASLAVRVNMKLDTATGVLSASFITIDRATGDTTTDQFAGFLPPNVNSPEGQGNITYSLRMKEGMADGTQLKNKATIIFDRNEPIVTNVWSNTLDIIPPSSLVTNVTAISDTSANMTIVGNDATSGVEYFMLYSSENGTPYRKIGHVRSPLTFYGRQGGSYHFYAIAVDSVGNIETKAPLSEASIIFPGVFAIELGNIAATNEGQRHRIDWNTLNEEAGDKFEVQRSNNGREFATMQTVPARGAAGQYMVYDERPAHGRTYYRLKTIDKDGRIKFSKVVSAYLAQQGEFVLEAYPNPVKNQLNISISGTINGKASVTMLNMVGTVVDQIDVLRNQVSIDMSKHPAGVYYIRYQDNKNNKVIRISKQ